jgi:CRISPR/Cas system-associated exonuclease Cas4 (RecB family)
MEMENNFSVVEKINEFYIELEKLKQEKDRVKIWISEVGKCPRGIFFKFKKAPKAEIEPEKLRIFEDGHFLQQKILRALSAKGLLRATEIPIPPHEFIAGKADAIISDSEGIPYVLEIKSISGRMNFQKLNPKISFPQHIYQLQLYLHFFKIKKGILLYINKDTQELKEFIFDYQPEEAERLLDWAFKLKRKIEENIIPLRLPNWPKEWECQNCLFTEICKLVGENEMSWEEFLRKMEAEGNSIEGI